MTPKFFIKREDSPQHGGARIVFATHVPRVLTEDDARELARELLSLTDPHSEQPVELKAPDLEA